MSFNLQDPVTGKIISFSSSSEADKYLQSAGNTTPPTVSTPAPLSSSGTLPPSLSPGGATTNNVICGPGFGPNGSYGCVTDNPTSPRPIAIPPSYLPVNSPSPILPTPTTPTTPIKTPPIPQVPQDIIDWGQAPPGYFYNAFGELRREEAQVFDTSGKQTNYLSTPTGIYSPQLNPSETNVRMIQTLPAFKPARITLAAGTPTGLVTDEILTNQDKLARVVPYITKVTDIEELPTTRLTDAQIKPQSGLPSWYASGVRPVNPATGELRPLLPTRFENHPPGDNWKVAIAHDPDSTVVLRQAQLSQPKLPPQSTSTTHILESVQKIFAADGRYVGDALIDRSGGAYAYRDRDGTYTSPPPAWGAGDGTTSPLQREKEMLAAIPQPAANRMWSAADGKVDVRLSQADIARMKSGEELYFVMGSNGIDISPTQVPGATNFSLRHQDIDWGNSSILIDTTKGTVDFNTNRGNFNIVNPNFTAKDYIDKVDFGHKGNVNPDAGFYRAFYEPLGIGAEWDKIDAQNEAVLVDYGKRVREATQQQTDARAEYYKQASAAYGQQSTAIQQARDLGFTFDIDPKTGAPVNIKAPSEAEYYIRATLLAQGTPLRESTPIDTTVFAPAPGTEKFVLAGPNKWGGNVTVLGTGNITHPLINQTDYGTLYKTDKDAWYAITPRGQMPQSGSGGSPMGILDTRSPMGSIIYNATNSQIEIMDAMKKNASSYIGSRRQTYNRRSSEYGVKTPKNQRKQPAKRTSALIYPIPKLTTLQSLAGEEAPKRSRSQKKKKPKKSLIKPKQTKRSSGGSGKTKIEQRMSRNVSKFLGW